MVKTFVDYERESNLEEGRNESKLNQALLWIVLKKDVVYRAVTHQWFRLIIRYITFVC